MLPQVSRLLAEVTILWHRRCKVLHSRGSNPPSTQEDMMEIAIAIGGLAAVFVGLGALILFTPYDK
jgi:hypothetical protein